MKYGIICAMQEELRTLKDNLNECHNAKIGVYEFFSGKLNGVDVVLVESGIGKVQASIVTTLLIQGFSVDYVLNSGSAGGIGHGLAVGDVVLSESVAYHDVDVTAFDYLPGQLPQQPQKFKADQNLLAKLKKAAKISGLNVKSGLIVSGDQFIASKEKIATIKEIYPEALCCEMEGAAVGQTAAQFGVGFSVIRTMSDTADEQANQSFDEFIIEAGKRSADMILNLTRLG